MSVIREEIKKKRVEFMKDKTDEHNIHRKNILTVFLGELETMEKNGESITDERIVQRLQSWISTNMDNIRELERDGRPIDELLDENVMFEGFMPVQMTQLELEKIISASGATNIGEAMQFLKKNHAGRYNGRDASTVAKRLFN